MILESTSSAAGIPDNKLSDSKFLRQFAPCAVLGAGFACKTLARVLTTFAYTQPDNKLSDYKFSLLYSPHDRPGEKAPSGNGEHDRK
jgi:hypothetical protein